LVRGFFDASWNSGTRRNAETLTFLLNDTRIIVSNHARSLCLLTRIKVFLSCLQVLNSRHSFYTWLEAFACGFSCLKLVYLDARRAHTLIIGLVSLSLFLSVTILIIIPPISTRTILLRVLCNVFYLVHCIDSYISCTLTPTLVPVSIYHHSFYNTFVSFDKSLLVIARCICTSG
jgi:hypothetical protein